MSTRTPITPPDAPADYDRTFDPAAYLRQFYSAPEVSDDKAAMFRGIADTIVRRGAIVHAS